MGASVEMPKINSWCEKPKKMTKRRLVVIRTRSGNYGEAHRGDLSLSGGKVAAPPKNFRGCEARMGNAIRIQTAFRGFP
ncbi:hypothetical protein IFM89_026875 [Coptis chinensis]|uniref:Uncharacterized protein n=1 Tax=Coptis chinensis TaxID=261450 RepID=A0A835LFW7_9MAGN|nr:hypothetical protein IFM89_026875 [Coptis chinensis]